MHKIGDYIVYKRDVSEIVGIKEKYYNDLDYFTLAPVLDKSLKIEVPINSVLIRELINKKEIDNLIEEIPNISVIDVPDRLLENEYKRLINSSNHENLVKIIKTTYERNKERIDNNKKIGDRDNSYFNRAEKYLYSELSVVLNLSLEDTKKYITDTLTLKINN